MTSDLVVLIVPWRRSNCIQVSHTNVHVPL